MGPARFGMMLPVGTKGELQGADGAADWHVVRSTALLAEQLGYHSVHVPDHLHNTPVAANRSLFECWTTLAALAEATSTVRLAQSVNCAAFRNPALLAKMTSNVDVISGGRLDWVVGAGWFEPEYQSYGYDYGTPKERLALLEETIVIVTSMWVNASTTFRGRFCTVVDAQCEPKPFQQPRPPVWVGGHGPRLMRLAARHADRVMTGGSLAQYEEKLANLERGCAAENRDPASVGRTWFGECLLVESEREIRDHYEHRKAATMRSRTGGASDEAWKKLFDDDVDAWSDKFLCGTVEQISDKIEKLRGLGTDYFVLTFPDLPGTATMTAFAERIAPAFAS